MRVETAAGLEHGDQLPAAVGVSGEVANRVEQAGAVSPSTPSLVRMYFLISRPTSSLSRSANEGAVRMEPPPMSCRWRTIRL